MDGKLNKKALDLLRQIDRLIDKHTDQQTYSQTYKHTHSQRDRLKYRQGDRQTDTACRWINIQTGQAEVLQTGRQANIHTDI